MIAHDPADKKKRPKKPKLTDAEQYERFLDAAKQVGASEKHEDFNRVFKRIVGPKGQGRASREPER